MGPAGAIASRSLTMQEEAQEEEEEKEATTTTTTTTMMMMMMMSINSEPSRSGNRYRCRLHASEVPHSLSPTSALDDGARGKPYP